MANDNPKPKSLSEAIARLESAGKAASHGIKEDVLRELTGVKDALQELAPFFEQAKTETKDKAAEARTEIEESVRKNPWLVISAIGIVAFFVGWLFAQKAKKDE